MLKRLCVLLAIAVLFLIYVVQRQGATIRLQRSLIIIMMSNPECVATPPTLQGAKQWNKTYNEIMKRVPNPPQKRT